MMKEASLPCSKDTLKRKTMMYREGFSLHGGQHWQAVRTSATLAQSPMFTEFTATPPLNQQCLKFHKLVNHVNGYSFYLQGELN